MTDRNQPNRSEAIKVHNEQNDDTLIGSRYDSLIIGSDTTIGTWNEYSSRPRWSYRYICTWPFRTDLVCILVPEMERLGVATAGEVDSETLAERVLAEVIATGSVIVGRSEIGAWSRV